MTNQVVVDHRFENEPAKVVYKYRLPLSPDPQELELPIAAKFLHAYFVPGMPFEGQWLLWYEVPLATVGSLHPIVFQSMGTGVPFPKCARHVATAEHIWVTAADSEPQEVWHLYEYPSGARVVDA